MTSARLTVCIPAYNQPGFLREALHSLCDQGLPRTGYVVAVSDDASPAALDTVVDEFRDRLEIVYHRNAANLGHLENFERVSRLVETPLLSFLSHDDVVAPGHLGRSVAALEQQNAVMVASLILVHRYPGSPDARPHGLFLRGAAAGYASPYRWERAEWMALALAGTPLSMIGSVLQTAAYRKCARWHGFPVWHDRLMLAEMGLQGPVLSLPWIGGYYRVREGQMSHQLWNTGREEFQAASQGVLDLCAEHGVDVTDYWVTLIAGAGADERIVYLTLLHQALPGDVYQSIKRRCEERLQTRLYLGGRLDRLGLPAPVIAALRTLDRLIIRRQAT